MHKYQIKKKHQYYRYVSFLFISLFCFTTSPVYATEESLYSFTSVAEAKRFEFLIKEIRCVVCQNQSIADSNAPLAKDLRVKIYQLIKDKKSNEEIKNYLVQRYGEFILLRPRFNKSTAMLWVFPFTILTVIFIFLFRLIRKTPVKVQS